MHKYTPEEKQFMRDYVPGHSYKQILEAFVKQFGWGITLDQIKGYIANNKLNTGRNGRFEKGHEPANKGQKGVYYKGREKGWFKKGNLPKNHKPVGTESTRYNHNRQQKYVYVKIAEPNRWRMKHIVEWEQHHGQVPKGKIIIFLDGDQLNTSIDNLAAVDRGTHARLNQMHLRFSDKDLTRLGISTAELTSKIAAAKRSKRT